MHHKLLFSSTLLALSIVMVMLTTCSRTDQAAHPEPAAVVKPTAAAQPSGEAVTMYLLDFSTDELTVYAPLFEQFTAETGLEVEVFTTWGTSEDYLSGMQQELTAGSNEADIYLIDVIWPGFLAEHALDLTPYIPTTELEAHIPAILENYTVAGRQVALPFQADAGLLYYRTDLLQQYGFAAPPQSWNDLEKMATVIQAGERAAGNNEFWGFVWQGAAYEGLTCDALEWQASHGGGQIIEPDGTITVNNPAAIAAFERAAGWVGTISPPDSVEYDETLSRAAWQNGNAAFMRNWPYAFHLSDNDNTLKGRFDIAVLPADGVNRAATLGGWGLMVSKYSSRPDAAVRLVQLLVGYERQKIDALAGILPTIEALYHDPDVLATQPQMAGLLPVVQSAVARPSTVTGAQYPEVSAAYYNHVHSILTGEVSAAKGVTNLEAELIDITGFEAQKP